MRHLKFAISRSKRAAKLLHPSIRVYSIFILIFLLGSRCYLRKANFPKALADAEEGLKLAKEDDKYRAKVKMELKN